MPSLNMSPPRKRDYIAISKPAYNPVIGVCHCKDYFPCHYAAFNCFSSFATKSINL